MLYLYHFILAETNVARGEYGFDTRRIAYDIIQSKFDFFA